jgi:MGT family glycosyltransferase
MLRRLFSGARVLRRAKDLIALARDWRPDVILRDSAELGGYLAAEVLGIPHISVGSTGGPGAPAGDPSLAAAINAHRDALGLPPDPGLSALYRYLHINLMPATYDPAPVRLPNAHCYRQTNPARAAEDLPQWLGELPDDRPLVFASLGTLFHAVPGRIETILAALAQVPCSAIVAIGRGKDPAAFAPQPDHLRLVDVVPQPLLLECCDLFLTHGGFNSAREALRLGVPLAVTPVLGDQPYNAQRCAAVGVALALSSEMPSAAAVADACRTVLADPRFRRRARSIQRGILSLPSLDMLAADVERRFA